MGSSRTVTLFSEQRDLGQGPSAFLVSILVHGAAFALIALGCLYPPDIARPVIVAKYTVRRLDLETPREAMRQAAGSAVQYPGPQPVARALAPGGKPLARPPVLREMAKAARGPQTLVQPDVAAHLALKQEIPVPSVVIWTPVRIPVKTIVAPLPEQPTAADVTPSLEPPNQEVNLADMELASSRLPTQKLQVLPSTTSPVVVKGPQPVQMAPELGVQTSLRPTPATVISLSDLAMPKGTVTLPPVNETAAAAQPGAMAPGETKDTAKAGRGNAAGAAGGAGAGKDAGAPGNKPVLTAATGRQNGAQTGFAQGAQNGSGTSMQPTADRITLPRDGEFGSIVVGDSLQNEFPEVAGVWNGRIAYTVYLHVGLEKSWILQYSLPPLAAAADAGNLTALEAPWPYNIVRPNLTPGSIDADALLVHGFVDRDGRFQSLAIAFPPNFAQAQFVLNSLAQWQFRPATEAGQAAKVEVLLIIPEEMDASRLRQPAPSAPRLIDAAGLLTPSLQLRAAH